MGNNFCECLDLTDKNRRIHELEEKIREYKAKVRDLYQVDISALKETIRSLKEKIEVLEDANARLDNEQRYWRSLAELKVELTEFKVDDVREHPHDESQFRTIKVGENWESVVISYPKGKKISNAEVYFQEEE